MKALTKAIAIALCVVVVASIIGAVIAVEGVDEGHVKVHKNKGGATGDVFTPGNWYIVNPVTESTQTVEVRPRTVDMRGDNSVYVITQDGQDVWVDLTIRYSVEQDQAVQFYKEYNTHKQATNRLITPTVRSDVRDEASNMSAREVITKDGRQSLEDTATEALQDNFEGTGMTLEAVQVRGIELNEKFATSLEEVEIERTNAERKQIEAQADRDAFQTRNEGLTNEILMEMYIQSIDEGDTVVLATGDDGTPVIMNMDQFRNQGGNTSFGPETNESG